MTSFRNTVILILKENDQNIAWTNIYHYMQVGLHSQHKSILWFLSKVRPWYHSVRKMRNPDLVFWKIQVSLKSLFWKVYGEQSGEWLPWKAVVINGSENFPGELQITLQLDSRWAFEASY